MTWLERVVTGLIGFVGGLAVAGLALFSWKSELDLGDVLNFLAVTIVGAMLSLVLQKRQGTEQVQKQLLTENAREVLESARYLHTHFREVYVMEGWDPREVQHTHDGIRDLALAVANLEQALRKCAIDPSKVGFAAVDESRSGYRTVLTGDPFPTEKYTAQAYVKEAQAYSSLKRAVVALMIDVNQQ